MVCKALLAFFYLSVLIEAAEPPIDVEAALKSRVQEFYQLQVERKFRQAEQLVAADTKDFYYGSQKPDLKAFDIKSIKFAADFQRANVTVSLRRVILFVGAGPQIMDLPVITTWKIDDGKWCWYVDQSKLMDTPLGHFNPGPDVSKDEASRLIGQLSSIGSMDGVHADRSVIRFDSANPSPQVVTLKNTLPGEVTIQSLTSSPALKIEIAKPNLGAEESTQLTVTPVAGNSERPAQVVLKIGPLGQMIRIGIEYTGAK